MEAPNKIWMTHEDTGASWSGSFKVYRCSSLDHSNADGDYPEYIRADIVEKLINALYECQDELDQYSHQEYPLDHPVHEQYRQRDFEANPARLALANYYRDTD